MIGVYEYDIICFSKYFLFKNILKNMKSSNFKQEKNDD
jgi:hypothetical protein